MCFLSFSFLWTVWSKFELLLSVSLATEQLCDLRVLTFVAFNHQSSSLMSG